MHIARRGKQQIIWGGSSKGVIFALYMLRVGVEFGYIVDINPVKQGRFLLVIGLPVIVPADAVAILDPGSDVSVMNPYYLDEIVERSNNRYNYVKV